MGGGLEVPPNAKLRLELDSLGHMETHAEAADWGLAPRELLAAVFSALPLHDR